MTLQRFFCVKYLDSSAVHEKYPPELARVFHRISAKVFLEAGHNCASLTYEKS